jgi:hypothetical protein
MHIFSALKRMAKHEFCAGHNVQQATNNIRQIFGYYSIEPDHVSALFNEFKKSNFKPFTNAAAYRKAAKRLFQNGFDKRICYSMLSQIDNFTRYSNVTTNDGRFGYFTGDQVFNVVDLFHGEIR